MKFGQRKADAPEEPSGDGMYLRAFKDGDTKVRFLQETDDWIVFREHYNKDRRAFPCTGDQSCPGCSSNDEDVQRSSRKYATHVQVLKGNYVAPFRIPISLARRMFARAERNDGVITDRDYVIMRSGKGLETDYDVDPDDKYEVNTKALLKEAPSIDLILERMYEDNAPGGAPVSKSSHKEEEAEEPLPSKAEAQSDSAGDSVIEIDEDELYEMSLSDLADLALKAGADVGSGDKKSDLIRKILATA